MKLRTRLAVVFGALGLVSVATVSTLAYLVAADEVRQSVDAELEQRITPFASFRPPAVGDLENVSLEDGRLAPRLDIEAEQVAEAAANFLNDPSSLEAEGDATQFRIIWSDGTFTGGPSVPPTDAAIESLDTEGATFETVDIDGVPHRVLTGSSDGERLFENDGRQLAGIQLLRDITGEEETLDDLAVRLSVLSAVAVGILVVTSLLVGRWLSRPITRLTDTAEQLAELDDIPGRVEIRRSDEIGQMADSYNRLLSAIEVSREQQRRLVADASHELRTPLTSLRMRLEHLQTGDVEPERGREILAGAIDDTEQLSVLASDLVDLAAAIRRDDEDPTDTGLGDLVAEVAERVERRTGRSIEVHADDTVAAIRPTMVTRALQNLLDNATKYSADGTIEVHTIDGRVEVRDHGPGIPEDDLDHVFDRFFRSPKARTRPGNGIGLAIVREVADVHGGDAWARNHPGGGAVVGFSVT